jgi:hypothetical protein
VTRGKVVWEGANERGKSMTVTLRLYAGTWENPNPEKTVTHIDFVTDGKTVCAPFCVAISADEHTAEKVSE